MAASVFELIDDAQAGRFAPVCVLSGSERLWIDRAVRALRDAVVGDSPAGFNEDVVQGQGAAGATILGLARTLPMMSRARFVLVRNADAMATSELESLVPYLAKPAPETCLVLVADKLDGRSRFAKAARESGVWIDVETPRPADMRGIAVREAKARGHLLDQDACEALVDSVGTDLSSLDDALERLSLFVGEAKTIDAPAVHACVSHVREASIWTLVDSVGARDAATAVATASALLHDREPPLRILAMVARQLRTVAKMRDALASGLKPAEAAARAGAPPFKARELAEAARRFDERSLAHAFGLLADADLALKGSKVPGSIVLERALLELCGPATQRA